MDFSIAIFVQNVLHNAVREGVRFAVTQQTGGSGQDAAIKAIVVSNSFGFLPDATTVSVTYSNPSTLAVVTGSGSNGQGNICVVGITNYAWRMMVPIWQGTGANLYSAYSSDVMEAPPNGILPTR